MDPMVLVILLILLFSVIVHECAHGWVAYRLGDSTAKDLGRLTLDPIPHIDPFMTILLPIMLLIASGGKFAFGGAKPVPVNPWNLRHPRRDMMWVAIAGPAANVGLALCAIVLWRLGLWRTGPLIAKLLLNAIYLNMMLAAFNLLPIPPLDGSRVLARYLKGEAAEAYARMERYGLFIIMGLFWFVPGFFGTIMGYVMQITNHLLGASIL